MNYLDRKLKRFRDKKAAQAGKKLNGQGKSKAELYQISVQEQMALESKQREIIAKLPAEIKDFGAIVGRWIWIWYSPHFVPRVRPHYELLRKLGFVWSKRREAWANSCGVESGKSRKDPRFGGYYKVIPLGKTPVIPAREYTEAELEANGCPF